MSSSEALSRASRTVLLVLFSLTIAAIALGTYLFVESRFEALGYTG